ncbi:MAG TPA: FkbM family methyltransferase [Bryobacteraceae bacterium]
MEFSEDIFKRRIAALLPAKAASRGVNGDGHAAQSSSKQDPTDLSGLWSIIDDEPFLQEAYRKILSRECDVSGFVNYLELLRRHVPRRVIVLQLVNSDEARRRGVRFVGIPGSVSVAGRQTAFPSLRRMAGRIVSQARELLRRPLYARFDSIDHKLNFLLHDVTAKADSLSTKSDEALWTISKKLDTYVANLQDYQMQIRDLLGRESAATTGALARLEDTQVRLLSEQAARYAAILAQQAAIEARLAGTESQITALRDSTRRILPPAIAAGNNVVATEVDGFILGMPAEEWRMAAYHVFRGVMEPGLTTWFRTLVKPGMVVVDVGANIGIYTLYAARLLQGHGRIHSFEPTPRTHAILHDNVQVNGFLELGIVEFHLEAVSDRSGTARLTVFPADSGHNTLFDEASPANGGEQIQVSTVSLDEILKLEPRVDVVKIDAEGAEPWILRGMRQIIARSPGIRILMEFAPVNLRRAGVDPGGFLDEIAALGFHVRRIHDETGQPLESTRDELLSAFSANVELADPSLSGAMR